MNILRPVEQLDVYGPAGTRSEGREPLSMGGARAYCRRLAHGRYENFSVLSALVPRHLRDDFAAVYAFCRWADDLGDEVGDHQQSLELLAWWRGELQQCFAGGPAEPRHPVFIALRPVIEKHDLPIDPFDDLISAFEQDQTVTRYDTWQQVLDYCRLSANPVGRLVLMVCGERRTDELFVPSDAVCTALQLTNHWQDVRRDILERDRTYIPGELIDIESFEQRLRDSARQGWGVDREFLAETRPVIRECVDRTWALYEQGAVLLHRVRPEIRPLIWLFAAGGQHVLRSIEMWNYETALHRPRLTRLRKAMLVGRAWLASRFGTVNGATESSTA